MVITTKNLAIPTTERKRLGAFYTPENLSQILCDWAIRSPIDRVLEPSFGRCGFLKSARRRLAEVGARIPERLIYGCDIDQSAFAVLAEMLGGPVDLARFSHGDFLELIPSHTWPHLFNASIGNPPYIPYQAIDERQRRALAKRAQSAGADLGGRASLWAHFLIHAVGFLEDGGRLAWVLPGAILQADYAAPLRDFLVARFARVAAVLIRDRLFISEGTDEETVILLADGRRKHETEGTFEVEQVQSTQDLEQLLTSWDHAPRRQGGDSAKPAELALIGHAREVFDSLVADPCCRSLGELARVKIGLVTGANQFFVLDQAQAQNAALARRNLLPVLAKMKAAPGLSLTIKEYDNYIKGGGKGLLVHANREPRPNSALGRYLETFPISKRTETSTFKKRRHWFAPDDGRPPAAFLSVMHHDGPRLVLNDANINCTNTIHRVVFKEDMRAERRQLAAISLLSTFSQISAELVGRRYGSGVLKHEPREAELLRLLLPEDVLPAEIATVFSDVDAALRSGDAEAARHRSDEFLMKSRSPSEIACLEEALLSMRACRRPERRSQSVTEGQCQDGMSR